MKHIIFSLLFVQSCFLSAQNDIETSFNIILQSNLPSKLKIKKIDSLLENTVLSNNNSISLSLIYYQYSKWFWVYQKNKSKAIYFGKKAVELFNNQYPTDTLTIKKTLYNLGYFYKRRQIPDYRNSLYYYNKLISITNAPNDRIGNVFREVGDIFEEKGDISLAIDNYYQSERIFLKTKNEKLLFLTYLNISSAYAEIKDTLLLDQFYKNQQKLKSLFSKKFVSPSLKLIYYINTGVAYSWSQKNQDSTIFYYNNAIKIAKQLNDSSSLFKIYNNLGVFYKKKKKLNLAKTYFIKSSKYINRNLLHKSTYYNNLADLNLLNHNFKKAQFLYDKSIFTLFTQNGDVLEIDSEELLQNIELSPFKKDILPFLTDKSNALLYQFKKTKNKKLLRQAYDIINLADKTLDYLFFESNETLSKLYWREKASNLYETALKICFKLKKPDKAFFFMEKNKGLILIENLIWNNFLINSKISSKILDKNYRFKEKLRSILNQNNINKKERYFALKNEYLSFIDSIKNKHPLFNKLKNKPPIATVSSIRESIDNKTIVSEFFFNNNSFYTVCFTKDSIFFNKKDTILGLKHLTKEYKKRLIKPFITVEDKNEFIKKSNLLFCKLFPLFIRNNLQYYNKLIVIPDGELLYLPFESLCLTSNPKKDQYLIKHLSINYKFSMSIDNLNLIQKSNTNKRIAFILNSFKNPSQKLLHSNLEEKALGLFFEKENIFKNKTATKKTFLDNYIDASIVHISSHGGSDNQNPWIFLYDKKLVASDLYTTNHSSELVILNACKTSTGRYKIGEGVFSMTRDFIQTGSKSVISSLWNVTEKSNSEIISNFYRHLSNNFSKAESLRLAKLKYLNKYKNTSQASPYYWSSLIFTGLDAKIPPQNKTSSVLYIILTISILIILFFTFKKPYLFYN